MKFFIFPEFLYYFLFVKGFYNLHTFLYFGVHTLLQELTLFSCYILINIKAIHFSCMITLQ